MDLRLKTEKRFIKHFFVFGAILMFFCLIISNDARALGVTLNGKTKFAGIPAGIIRDIEVVGDAVYIASENGVFKYLGGQSERVSYDSTLSTRGTVSDLYFDGKETLWIVEFGVGVYKFNVGTGLAESFHHESKWPKYAWKIGVLEHYVVVSLISGIIVVDIATGELQSWASNVGVGNVERVLSLSVSKSGLVFLASKDGLVIVDPDRKVSELIAVDNSLTALSSVDAVSAYDSIVHIGGKEGVYAWDMSTNEKRFYPFKIPSSSSSISDVYVSELGRLYVAAGGLFEIKEGRIIKPDFMSPLITSDGIKSIVKIAELPSGELLIASSQLGLVSISHSHEAINLVHQNGQVFRKNIKSFGTSSDFGYAVGTKDQDFLIDLKTGEVKPFSFWENNSCIDELLNEISAEFTNTVSGYDFCSSEYSHITSNSVSHSYVYHDSGENAFYNIIDRGVIVDKIPAPQNMITSVLTASGEIAGFDANSYFHIQMSKFNWKSISPDEGKWVGLTCLIELENTFLLCTSGQGIKSINKRTGEIASSTLLEDTGARFIRGALLSTNDNLWFLSNMGLFVVTSDGNLISFNENDGIFDTDFEYRGIQELGDRIIVLGDKYSYVISEKKAILAMKAKENIKSRVVFTRIDWAAKDSKFHKMLQTTGGLSNPIMLESDFDAFAVDFRTNSFSENETQKLEYRVLGIDDEWSVHPQSQAFLTLSDLRSGSYEFQARVMGVGNPISTLAFEVKPPIYFQRFAFWIYLTITLSLIIAYKLNYLSKVWGYFKTTKLYNHLTRYEITDGHSKFEKMLRSKERFINEITHELRTPIQLINGSLEGISKTAHAASKELICVQDNMKRVEQLINQMSQDVPKALAAADYYRSYSPDNIKFIVLSLEPLAKQKRQNLELRIKGKKEISLINDSLEKILANLIQNAIKFTPELGTIKVAAIQDSKVLKVIVSDDGEGIDEHFHKKVFERFTKGSSEHEGHGVGLAMVKTLVELNQGEIALESQKGIGTKVTVTLPIDDIEYVNSHAEKLSPANAKSNKKSLLIVDDSREFRSYLFDLFSSKYRCLVARNGVQALDVMQHYLVDLVITDQMMHEMDGLSLIREIRGNVSYASIPILMFTAETGTELEKSALEEKVDYFLAKPASKEEITLRVEHLLSVREAKEREEEESEEPAFKFGCLKIPEFDNEKDMAFFLNFIAVLEKNYHNESFNRDQAASQLLISPRSLNRRMSELFEYNFSEFLSRFRIEKSIPLLLEGNSILDTCLDVGFGTAAYFSTSFKKVMSLPPKKFVEQYNKTVA
tara:strand:- start:97 stop:3978 length:3882 start_codon:yes stop_codon:yes gene_type:complete